MEFFVSAVLCTFVLNLVQLFSSLDMKEMLCRCSLDDLAIWYIPSTMGGDNKNGFLKTGVNLSYLEFLFEFVFMFL